VRAKFLDLARELGEFGVWVRLHYVYPYPHVDDVIPLMADGKVLPYLDVPFQHASPAVLKRMRRPAAQEKTLERIRAWREICPSLTIRSTFIVGFPGETEEDFSMLLDWLGEAELDRVGCFRYEPVAGAAANDLGAPVPAAPPQASRSRTGGPPLPSTGSAAACAPNRCSSSETRRVLPTPESPPSRTSVDRPAVASRTASSSSASSPTRPTKWLLVSLERIPEVSTDGGGHGNARPGDTAGRARRRCTAGTGGVGAELIGALARHDGGELGMHVGFLSMAST